MINRSDNSIRTGEISGTGIAVGHGAQATVLTITQESHSEILSLLEQLRDEIQEADISDGAKQTLLSKAISVMEKAMQSDDPKPGLVRGFEQINDQFEAIGSAANNVSGIIATLTEIARYAGIAIKAVAPFLSSLL